MENSFLHQTAQAIIKRIAWQDLNRTTLVLPSHRAGVVLKDELLQLQQEAGVTAVWAPQVMTLDQLFDRLCPLYEEDELLTVVRLYKIYLQSPITNNQSPLTLDQFYNWGRQLIADFTNVDASMKAEQVPNFFDNTIAARELDELNLDPEVQERLKQLIHPGASSYADKSIRAQYQSIWSQLDTIYAELHQQMAAEHKGYAGMRQRAVIEHWDTEAVQKQIAGRTYIFVGFNYLLPVEYELLQLFKLSGQALFFWDFVPNFQTNAKAFHYASLNASRLGNDGTDITVPVSEPHPATILSCTSAQAQAQFVHSWLKANYTAPGQKVGVVICDESMLESVIYTLPAIRPEGEEETVPINITKGFPLRNTHIFTRVLNYLYDPARGDVNQVVSPDFIDNILAELFQKSTISAEKDDLSDEIETLNWKELLILESEYQVRKLMNQMRKIISDGIGEVPFTLKLLRLLMRRVMENISMPFHGEPISDIQIMGVLETRLLDFDKLLILNVEEGVLPQKLNDASFIPYYLRKAYSMQTPEERASVYAYNFFRLLSRAGHSTLLFTSIDGGENSKGPSRFIMQMLVSPEFNVTKRNLIEPSMLSDIDLFEHTRGISLMDMMHLDARNRWVRADGSIFRLSPSALNSFLSCPRQFCLQYILGIRTQEKPETTFSAATRGSFVHHALQYIFEQELACTALPVITPDEIERIMTNDDILDKAIQAAYAEMPQYKPEEHRIERPVLMQFIRNVLERDMRVAREQGLQISELEIPRYFTLDLGKDDDGMPLGSVQLGGRVDRIDRIGPKEQQIMRIVDYKSGTYKEKKMSATTEELMSSDDAAYIRQTFIYSQAVLENRNAEDTSCIEPHLYFCAHPMDEMETRLTFNAQPVTDFAAVSGTFMAELRQTMKTLMKTTDFAPCEESDCPSFCPFLDLCRRKAPEW